MKESKIKFALCQSITFFLALILCVSLYFYLSASHPEIKEKSRFLTDASFITSVIFFSAGSLWALSSYGGFSALSYGFYIIGFRLNINRKKIKNLSDENTNKNSPLSYSDFIEEKSLNKRSHFFICPLLTGLVFLIISALILLAFKL